MRRHCINGASPTEPADGDDLPAALRVDNAVAVAKVLSSVSANALYESLLRTMLVKVNANATAMIMITNACFQQGGDD